MYRYEQFKNLPVYKNLSNDEVSKIYIDYCNFIIREDSAAMAAPGSAGAGAGGGGRRYAEPTVPIEANGFFFITNNEFDDYTSKPNTVYHVSKELNFTEMYKLYPEMVIEDDGMLADGYDGFLYQFNISDDDDYGLFKKINMSSLEITYIPLSDPYMEIDSLIGFYFSQSDQCFYAIAYNGYYKILKNGTITLLSTSQVPDNYVRLFDINGVLHGFGSDPSYGNDGNTLFEITFDQDNDTFIKTPISFFDVTTYPSAVDEITYSNGVIYYINLDPNTGYTRSLFKIVPNNGIYDTIQLVGPTQRKSLFNYSNALHGVMDNVLYTVNTSDGISTEFLSINRYESFNSNLCFNVNDNHLYNLCYRENDENDTEYIELYKIDPITGSSVTIAQSQFGLYSFTDAGQLWDISDGGDDIYDGGNRLETNLSPSVTDTQGFIKYTHTQAQVENIPYLTPSMDGVIMSGNDSDIYFGSGSSYFTNMYPNMFVMIAENIDISYFGIKGNLGADGSGSTDSYSFTVTKNSVIYSVFICRVFGAGDPSINQIIITQYDPNLSFEINSETDNSNTTLTGLDNSTSIYYLLLSKISDKISDTDVELLVDEFLEILDTNINDTLSNLNDSYSEITSIIPQSKLQPNEEQMSLFIANNGVIYKNGQTIYVIDLANGEELYVAKEVGEGQLLMFYYNGELWWLDMYAFGIYHIDNITKILYMDDTQYTITYDLGSLADTGWTVDNIHSISCTNDIIYLLVDIEDGENWKRAVFYLNVPTGVASYIFDAQRGQSLVSF